jgi:hypothetical protein
MIVQRHVSVSREYSAIAWSTHGMVNLVFVFARFFLFEIPWAFIYKT